MAKSSTVVCPHCGGHLLLTPQGPTVPRWTQQLGKLLAYFCEEAAPVTASRLIMGGTVLGLWTSRAAGYRRLNQMVLGGWITTASHGWYTLTDKGREIGRTYLDGLASIPELAPPPSTPPPERPIQEDQVARPSQWQIFFLQQLQGYSPELVGLNAVIRHTKKEGYLGKGGTAQIKALMADGWLCWEGERVVISEAAKKLLLEIAPVDGTPRVNDQPPST